MATLGNAVLILALGTCVFGIVASLYGARAGRPDWVEAGRRSIYALAGLGVLAFALLEVAFIRNDLSFQVVANHSSSTTPLHYRIAAPWSSQEGSLLLWLMLLGVWSALVVFLTRRRLRDVQPYAIAVLLGFAAFFAALLVFSAKPFLQWPNGFVPVDGSGLQPLLRHPTMLSHPVFLYSGYTLFTVPFAYAVGALIVRRVDAEWIAATRRFALAAWLFLGIGIFLGARWSYAELGWGGYWAWDPVENASLLPWLTGTAFIHSIMLQERRGMLKVWNASLILATGTLAILGTFLVRSGILDSIHAFGASTLGTPFLIFLATLIFGSIFLVTTRQDALRSEHRLESMASREAIFLLNNLAFVAIAFVVAFLTFFPLIAEAVTGTKRAVGPPMYDRFVVPLTLVLVLLSGIAPLLAWRRASWGSIKRAFTWPLAAALAVLVVCLPLGAADRPYALAMFVLGGFVTGGILQEVLRGTKARKAMSGERTPLALVSLVRRNRRRYGGYMVHFGMVVLFVGVAASTAFQSSKDVSMGPGDSATVNGYTVTYVETTADYATSSNNRPERISIGAKLRIEKDGKQVAVVESDRGYYPSLDPSLGPVGRYFEGESTSEIGLKAGATRDVWIAIQPDQAAIKKVVDAVDRRLDDADADTALRAAVGFAGLYKQSTTPAQFRIIVSPLVSFVWIGAFFTFLGGIIALWPAPDAVRRRATAGYAARVARDLGRA